MSASTSERVDDDRLPRSRLSRQQVEAVAKLDGEVLDDRQVADAQGAKDRHAATPLMIRQRRFDAPPGVG